MNVAPRTFVSPRSWVLITAFTTEPGELSTLTSAGYSQTAASVNASDRPQADAGHGSAGAASLSGRALPSMGDTPEVTAAKQRPCFRLDLCSPYGQVLV